jgi:hypothetical protein
MQLSGFPHSFKDFSNIFNILSSQLVRLANEREKLINSCSMLRNRISSTAERRSSALIPWENKHDVDQDQFEEQYGRITRDHENTKQRLDALQNEGPERDQILEEMVAKIRDEIDEEKEELDDR